MTADALKSLSVTNLDAFPVVRNTSPKGAKYDDQKVSDFVTPTAAGLADTTSTYKMVRVPTNVYLQHIRLIADSALDTGGGSAALAVDVGAYYSDSTIDGTPAALQGTKVGSSDNQFADAFALKGQTDVFVTSGSWTAAKRQKQLWDALGLTSDPGGNFDIVVSIETAANTAASVGLTMEVTAILE